MSRKTQVVNSWILVFFKKKLIQEDLAPSQHSQVKILRWSSVVPFTRKFLYGVIEWSLLYDLEQSHALPSNFATEIQETFSFCL